MQHYLHGQFGNDEWIWDLIGCWEVGGAISAEIRGVGGATAHVQVVSSERHVRVQVRVGREPHFSLLSGT